MIYIKFMVIETLKKSIAKIPLLYFCMLLTMPFLYSYHIVPKIKEMEY